MTTTSSTAQIADFDLTPWQLYGWKVTYRLGYRLVDVAERLRRLGERVPGKGRGPTRSSARRRTSTATRWARKAAARALMGGEASR